MVASYKRRKVIGGKSRAVKQLMGYLGAAGSGIYKSYASRKAAASGSSGRGYQRTIKRGRSRRTRGNRMEGGVTTQHDSRLVKARNNRSSGRAIRRKWRKYTRLNRRLLSVGTAGHVSIGSLDIGAVVQAAGVKQQYFVTSLMSVAQFEDLMNDVQTVRGNVTENLANVGANYNTWAEGKAYLKNLPWELSVNVHNETLATNVPMVVDVYFAKCYRDQIKSTENPATVITTANAIRGTYGAGVEAVATLGSDPCVTPYDFADFTKFYRIYRHEQFMLGVGHAVTLQGTLHLNKVLSKVRTKNHQDGGGQGIKGVTEVMIITVRDAEYNAGVDGVKGLVNVRVTRSCHWKPCLNDYTAGPVSSKTI